MAADFFFTEHNPLLRCLPHSSKSMCIQRQNISRTFNLKFAAIECDVLPDCLRSRQLGQRGAGRVQIQLDGPPADVRVRLARLCGSHQSGRVGLCGLLNIVKFRMCNVKFVNCFCFLSYPFLCFSPKAINLHLKVAK